MRRIGAVLVVLTMCKVASAEPRWSVGFRTTWNSQLDPPPWIMTGGQWGLRLGDHTWLMLDADGMRGDTYEMHDALGSASARTLMVFGLGPTTTVLTQGHNALRVLGGAGAVIEWANLRTLGNWATEDTAVRLMAFAGAAFEHRFVHRDATRDVTGGAIGLELRGVRLFGDGPMSDAPALSRWSAQATLEMSAYF